MIAQNGNQDNSPPRRLRLDRIDEARPGEPAAPTPGHSGRLLVLGGVLAVLVLWASLSLAFRGWRRRYETRAAFGATQVASAVDPLADVVPPRIDRRDWHQAVAQTHAMLVKLTALNLLGRPEMEALRDELRARVARARPETAPDELARIWDDLKDRAGPNLREPRPKLLPRRPGPPPKEAATEDKAGRNTPPP